MSHTLIKSILKVFAVISVSAIITFSIPKSTCACLSTHEILTHFVRVGDDAAGNEIEDALRKKLEGLNVAEARTESYYSIFYICPKLPPDAATDQSYSCRYISKYSFFVDTGWQIELTVKPGRSFSDVKIARAFNILGHEF